ncbi:hypothetical protein AN958_08931 [Leucoagaricus sp. SymC.cos]|nr:hypothetical protein AN958_08931 [Leucoagaricus sp. SymC.cos]
MPVPGTKQAPDFDSKNPKDLRELLEEFEELAERNGLTVKEKAKMVVKYVDKETKAFWKRLEGYNQDYGTLKKKIMKAYSKTLLDDKPTVAHLVKIINQSAKEDVEDEEDLDTYYRKFWIIAADLVEANVINDKQRDEYFWKGIPCDLHYAIGDHLEAQDKNYESSEVPEMEKAVEAGRFVLRKAAARGGFAWMTRKEKKGKKVELSSDGELELGDDSEESEGERLKKKSEGEVRMRKVRFEEGGKKDVRDQVEELMWKLLQLDVKDDQYALAYAQLFVIAPALTDKLPPPPQFSINTAAVTNTAAMSPQSFSNHSHTHTTAPCDPSCHFCKRVDCHMRTCPEAAEYVRWGWVILQSNGYYAHSDGSCIG